MKILLSKINKLDKNLAIKVANLILAEVDTVFIEKLENYIKEYTDERKLDLVEDLKQIIIFLKKDNWEDALKKIKKSELWYDLKNSAGYIEDKVDERKLERMGLAHWCEKPGEYIAYRVGSIDKNKRGIYFAATYAGSRAYKGLHKGFGVHKYLVSIKKPLVTNRQETAILKMGGKLLDTSKPNGQKKLDTRFFNLLKKNNYDSAVLKKPAPPALKELVIFNPKSIKKDFGLVNN